MTTEALTPEKLDALERLERFVQRVVDEDEPITLAIGLEDDLFIEDIKALLAIACREERLRAALEAVEWVETESGPGMVDGMCPWCQGWEPDHRPRCERQAALTPEEGQAPE